VADAKIRQLICGQVQLIDKYCLYTRAANVTVLLLLGTDRNNVRLVANSDEG
jgi:hypothetical protein